MKTVFPLAVGSILALSSCSASAPRGESQRAIAYPEAVVRGGEDPYRWMETEPPTKEMREWVGRENTVTESYLKSLPALEPLRKRFTELLSSEAVFRPVKKGGRLFYMKRELGRERPVLCSRSAAGSGRETIVVDPNLWTGVRNATLGGWAVNFQGRQVAYTIVPDNHEDQTRIEVVTLRGTQVSAPSDVLEGGKYALPGWLYQPEWEPSGRGFYYTYFPQEEGLTGAERQARAEARYHRMGTSQASDAVIYRNSGDSGMLIVPSVSRDEKWLFVTLRHAPSTNQVFYRATNEPAAPWVPLFDKPGTDADVFEWKGTFYNLTDWQAPNRQVLAGKRGADHLVHWEPLIAERPKVAISSYAFAGGKLFLRVRENASSRLEMYELDGTRLRDASPPGIGSVSGLSGDIRDGEAFFEYDTFTEAPHVFKFDIRSGRSHVWSQEIVPFDPSRFVSEQVWFPSKDGTPVSMFLVRDRSVAFDGRAPALLFAYGAWNASSEPSFDAEILPWLEAGGVYGLVNVRGGGEYGQDWHRAGSGPRKQHSFDDLAAAAESLARSHAADPERIAIWGISFGGLLVAGTLVERPELFRAVLCGVPVTDMLRYHLSGIGRNWAAEFGTAENPVDLPILAAYSPYQGIRSGVRYPAVFVDSADNDERVSPWHARKFVASLQAHGGAIAKGPIFLKTESQAGHGGAGLLSRRIGALSEKLAFLFDQLGIPPPSSSPIR